MRERRLLTSIVACVALAMSLIVRADDPAPVPDLHHRVTDTTATLSAREIAALDAKLAALEQRKGAQVAILLVPTTEPETIEQYAMRTFDRWKLGRKGVGDGVLVLVAKNDRRMRIEVGRGLEGAIPDAAVKRIEHEYVTPKFRSGAFADGLGVGVDRLTRLIDDESLPEPSERATVITRWHPLFILFGLVLGPLAAILVGLVLALPPLRTHVLSRLSRWGRIAVYGSVASMLVGLALSSPMAALGALFGGGLVGALARSARRSSATGVRQAEVLAMRPIGAPPRPRVGSKVQARETAGTIPGLRAAAISAAAAAIRPAAAHRTAGSCKVALARGPGSRHSVHHRREEGVPCVI